MKVAITGADGFLGKALTKKLRSKKISYIAFNSKKHNLLVPETLKSLVSGKDVIIHLAAVNRGENKDLVETNVLGTLSLLEAVSKYAPDTNIIFSSSFQVYLDEGLYGISKKTSEDLIIQYIKKSNLKGVILRISNIYGPGGKPFYNSVIATFAHLIKMNEPIKVQGDGSSKRDFIFVEDVADAIIKIATHKSNNPLEIVDICYGKETTLNEILKTLKNVSGKNFNVVYNTEAKDKPWPTSGKNFKNAFKLYGWKPTTPIEKGLKIVMMNVKKGKSALSKVKIKKLDKKEDTRGFVAEIVRREDLSDPDKKFGQIYVTTAKPGQTKGKHYHNRKTEWFCVVSGNGLLVLVDKKTKAKKEIKMGEDNMVAVEIPPGVWHAISNQEDRDMYLVAHISESFNPDDPDTFYEETP